MYELETEEKVKVWWVGSDGRADMGLCVYSCLVPSSFIVNGLGVRFYFLAEMFGYRTYNLSRWIIHTNCSSIQSLHVYVRINVS